MRTKFIVKMYQNTFIENVIYLIKYKSNVGCAHGIWNPPLVFFSIIIID